MKNKKIKLLFFSITIFCCGSSFSAYDLTYQYAKGDGGLRFSLLEKMANIANIFIETGTHKGNAVNNAKLFFDHVYSVEKERSLYELCVNKFKDDENVHLFHNDSSIFLAEILPNIPEKIFFWLDAHYGLSSTPIRKELEEIKNRCIQPPIILIDDIRDFSKTTNYPSVKQLKQKLLSINKNYQFVLLLDAALAFEKQLGLTVSPVLQACTTSYFFEIGAEENEQAAIEAEKIISLAEGEEKKAILNSYKVFKEVAPFYFWAGLILLNDQKYNEAKHFFIEAKKRGCNNMRIDSYLNLCSQ